MSGMLGGGSGNVKLSQQKKVEDVKTITDTANEEQQRARKRFIQQGGSQSTLGFGIAQALKKRLG